MPALRARWAERVTVATAEELRARSKRLPAITFNPGTIVQAGPFVRLDVDYSARYARGEDQAPTGNAGGIVVYLMSVEDGWVVVSISGWIT